MNCMIFYRYNEYRNNKKENKQQKKHDKSIVGKNDAVEFVQIKKEYIFFNPIC